MIVPQVADSRTTEVGGCLDPLQKGFRHMPEAAITRALVEVLVMSVASLIDVEVVLANHARPEAQA